MDENIAYVFHRFDHACHLSLPRKDTRKQLEKRIRDSNIPTSSPPKEFAIEQIINRIQNDDVDGAIQDAELFADLNDVARVQREVTAESQVVHDSHSVDALVAVKRKTDMIDPFLIYQFGIQGMAVDHTQSEDYVFKSSKQALDLALKMDIDATDRNPLQEEFAFIDGKFGRVQDFVSLAMWTYHPAARRILRLASMEIRSEWTRSISLFLCMFNKALGEVNGKPCKFNPRGIICDNAGAMENAVRDVLGERFLAEGCFAACRWHFRNEMTKKESSLREEDRPAFHEICKGMCEVGTVQEYNLLHERMVDISNRNSGNLNNVISWWHARKENLFPAFTGTRTPGVNLAEMGNAGWTKRNSSKMVRAAFEDSASMLLQNVQLRMFLQNQGRSSGCGPTEEDRNRRDQAEQRRHAAEYVEVLDSIHRLSERVTRGEDIDVGEVEIIAQELTSPSRFKPSNSCAHKPPASAKKGVQGAYDKPKKTKTPKASTTKSASAEPSIRSFKSFGFTPQPDSLSQSNDIQQTEREMELLKQLGCAKAVIAASQDSSTGSQWSDIELLQAAEQLEEEHADDIFKTPDKPLPTIDPVSHRQSSRGKSTGIGRGGRGGARGSVKNRRLTMSQETFNEALVEEAVRRNIQAAENLLGRRAIQRKPVRLGNEVPNPFILFRCEDVPNISRCFGCRVAIRKGELAPPGNFVVRKKGERKSWNSRSHQWFMAEGNIYFHANKKCLENYDGTFELRDLHIKDEVFGNLTHDQLLWLLDMGFLGQLTAIAKGRLP